MEVEWSGMGWIVGAGEKRIEEKRGTSSGAVGRWMDRWVGMRMYRGSM